MVIILFSGFAESKTSEEKMNLDNPLLTNRSTGGLSGTGEWDINQLAHIYDLGHAILCLPEIY